MSDFNWLNADVSIGELFSHQIVSLTLFSFTTNLSFGDRPVYFPVDTKKDPPLPSTPSSRFIASVIRS